MANPNPQNKFQKGNKLGRKPGQPNLMTKDIRTLLREAAEEVGFIQRVREHIRAARDAGGRNWCPIFYSAEARRMRSQFIGDSRVTGNGLPSSLKRGRTKGTNRSPSDQFFRPMTRELLRHLRRVGQAEQALAEIVPQGRAGRAAGIAQKPAQDSPDRREACLRGNAPATL